MTPVSTPPTLTLMSSIPAATAAPLTGLTPAATPSLFTPEQMAWLQATFAAGPPHPGAVSTSAGGSIPAASGESYGI